MATSRTLELIVRARDEASQGLKAIGGALDTLKSKFGSVLSVVTQTLFSLQGALAGAGLGFFVKSFIDAARETEGYRMQLRILTGDVERGNELFKQAADYAAKVTFEYRDIMGVVTQLRGVIKGGDEEVIKWMKLVGDVAAATGIDIRTTTEQISRMYSAGAQSAELFKERGKLAMLGFQTGVSYTVDQTRKKLMEFWEKADSPIKGAAAMLANTWDGLLSMIADKWFQFRTIMMESSGIFNYLKAALKTFVAAQDEFFTQDKMADWARRTGEVVIGVFEKIIVAASYTWDVLRAGGAGFKVLIDLAYKLAAALFSVATMGEEAKKPFTGINQILGLVGASIAWVGEKLADMADEIGVVIRYVIGLLEKLADTQQDLASFRFTPEFLKSTLLENAIKIQGTLKQWRIELAEGDTEIAAFRAGMRELAADSSKMIEGLSKLPGAEKAEDLLKRIRDLAAEIANPDYAKTGGVGQEEQKRMAKRSEILKAGLERLRADLDLELAMVQAQFDQRLIEMNEYYDKRRDIILRRSEAEIALQRALLKTEEISADPNKVIDVKTKIYELERKQITDIIKLEQERREKQKAFYENQKEVAKILQDIRERAESAPQGDLGATFDKELRDLQKKNEDIIESLKKRLATEDQLKEAARLQEMEKDKLLMDQKRRLNEMLLEQAKTTFGQMDQMFADLYEVSGKRIKAFFYLQKAASIATTVIQTMEAAQKSYNAMAGIPYVGPALGVAAAAVAVAAGMARVAVISSQTMNAAEGGEVKGISPHSRADNIKANLTAGEYVHPVATVQYYGKAVMEKLRKRSIPKQELARVAMAEGGEVRAKPLDQKLSGGVGHRPLKEKWTNIIHLAKNYYETTVNKIKQDQSTESIFKRRADHSGFATTKTENIVDRVRESFTDRVRDRNFYAEKAISKTIQSIAAGGEVQGYSPTKTADNIKANLTAGEFVHPVDTVRHYGKVVMEGLRQRLIPREVFANLNLPNIGAARAATNFAAGGAVGTSGSSVTTKPIAPDQARPININNIVDPSLMGQYLATTPGERQIINVISNNAFQIKALLLG